MEEKKILIRAENISLSYEGGETLLRGINFEIQPGTLYCLMGANAAGRAR